MLDLNFENYGVGEVLFGVYDFLFLKEGYDVCMFVFFFSFIIL